MSEIGAGHRVEAETEARDTAASKARLRLWLKLLKATKHVEGELRENLRVTFDTTLPRFDVMAALYRAEPGLKMSELSSVLRVSNGNVTGIVDRLVIDGILVRIPVDNDRRATTVRLTKAGREQFAQMAAKHEAWIDNLLEGVDANEAQQMTDQLERIARKNTKKGA
ncbi:MAG: MarR family transcriptional regulator [Hoeflea sp.]|uniref:MarR family winged helix-turn-helix transcriptional regulator n=1 Tax=Hoeflea sp. TaxID=1940281 RepID=UPI001DB73886|nr:MarR family transcriptional regulator [Hoeflea sp.]MBU4528727.1 MarR family transcriptional regulator [Alphaproteobacteria bacterium]MBU4545946.1 MarR family transcriptional regulator [Alphaproteobacteria bacterium]MBU4549861.1 MarR family transcriptional regulator [Alphaproteobacteria bacterium]MBV1725858.1 MarR family transcriptional regulator [Hoeflea sp.]MBV1762583.1 MarR family transcriptional regulator [Hoeflea sp.]